MIGDKDLNPSLLQKLNLVLRGDAVIHRDQNVGLVSKSTFDGGLGQTVAFLKAQRNEGHHLRTKLAQAARHDGGGRNAVKVEIAEDQDALLIKHGVGEAIGQLRHVRNRIGIEPIPIERGVEENLGALDVGYSPSRHNGCDERGKPQLLAKGFRHGLVRGQNADTC